MNLKTPMKGPRKARKSAKSYPWEIAQSEFVLRQTRNVPSVPLGFGTEGSASIFFSLKGTMRGLDPAFTFGRCDAVSRTKVKRCSASHIISKLHAHSRGRKSGVKPPHCAFKGEKDGGTTFGSKASRHSHAARVGLNGERSFRVFSRFSRAPITHLA